MATDIVLDDLTGDRITLTCSEVATGGDVTIDNFTSHSGPPDARVALRHDINDGLSINPERHYPFGVSIECANVNLKVHDQDGTTAELPRRGDRGDLLLICTHSRGKVPPDVPPEFRENCSLWLCVGRGPTGAANWAQVSLATPVAGTL